MPDTGIIHYPRGERVTASPAAKAPWDVLSANQARELAYLISIKEILSEDWAYLFREYANTVDAITRWTRIE